MTTQFKSEDTPTLESTIENIGLENDVDRVRIFVDHPEDDVLVVNDEATIVDAANGTVEYAFSAAQTARAGTHRVEYVVEKTDGTQLSWPPDGYIRLQSTEPLDRDAEVDEVEANQDLTLATLYADSIGSAADPVTDGHFGSLDTGSSFTDPAGVEHTGELADIGDTGGSVAIEDDGTTILQDVSNVNFGTDASVTDDGDGTVTVDVSGGSGTDTRTNVSEAGTQVLADVQDINFTASSDAAVTVSDDGDGTVTVDVSATGMDTRTDIEDDGTAVVSDVTSINFGSNVTVTDDGDGSVTVDAESSTDTRINVSSDGSLIVSEPSDVNFASNLSATDDGDGTVTVDIADSVSVPSLSAGSSFTDPAGVEHTGELADIEDVGDGGSGVDYTVNPDDYGAVGDGSTDDTQAFQDAIDSVGSSEAAILELTPGNHYYLASSVTVDVNKIRVIEGNNAYVVTDNDIYAIDLVGDKSTSGSNPGSGSNSTHAENEFGTHVQNLQAYSTNYSGTAIRVRDTFATFITDCNIAKMNNAIEFTDINRNHIVANNHIWDIANFGLYFNGGNFHQILVADNYIQWAYKVVRIVDGDMADFLFMNNNLETGNNEQNQSEIVFDAEITSSTNNMWDILIEGNVFDGHNGTNTGIRLKSTNLADEVLTGVRIVNNYISQFATTGIELEEMNQVTISNNHCERNVRQVNMTGECKAVSITDNVFHNLRSSDAVDGIHWTTDMLVSTLTIADNQFIDWTGPAIEIQDGSTSANNRSEVTISDNTIHLYGDGPTISGYLIDLNTSATLNDVHVRGNTVRGRDTGEDGIRVQGGSYTNVIMKDNIVRGITSGTAYTAPDGTLDGVIVQDNLANGVKTGAANYFFIGDTSPDNPQAGAVWIDTS